MQINVERPFTLTKGKERAFLIKVGLTISEDSYKGYVEVDALKFNIIYYSICYIIFETQ